MEFLKKHWPILLVSLLEIVIGILLLIQPVDFTNVVIIVTGILLVVRGLFSAVKYVRSDVKTAVKEHTLAKALILLAGGMFCILDSHWLINTFSTLAILYGVAILVMGFYKVQQTVDMLRMQSAQWLWNGISALVALAVGIVILANPFGNANALWIFTGICLLVEAVLDLVFVVLRGMKKKPAIRKPVAVKPAPVAEAPVEEVSAEETPAEESSPIA